VQGLGGTFELSAVFPRAHASKRVFQSCSMKRIRILLAEDQTLMRQGLKTLLELETTCAWLAKPRMAQPPSNWPCSCGPILSDGYPNASDEPAWRRLRRSVAPGSQPTVTHPDDVRSGRLRLPRAFAPEPWAILKDSPAPKLYETIRRVHAGEVFIQPEIASRALRVALPPQSR